MSTVQLLVEDAGNREVIAGFLDDEYDVLGTGDVREADAYLVEDAVYPSVKGDLQQLVDDDRPVFRPVVLIDGTAARSGGAADADLEVGDRSPVDDIIDAPVREPVLKRRMASLLERREQSQALQRKIEQVERQRNALSVLNQMVRHDIRNKLQLVLGYAQQLAEDVGREEPLETIIASTNNAIELTTEARDLTDLLVGEYGEIGSIRITEVVGEEIEAARETNPDVTIEFHPSEEEFSVRGDQMFGSVIRNLVTNAIEHNTADEPRVSVSIERAGDSVRVAVADNGPGIPDDDKGDIFDRGVIGADSSGTGVGLFLVSEVVDRYGGTVHVGESRWGGARFVVELPLAE
ncbi:MAG: sensor histidine kinase [Halodesulfurarchaeum sp.]